MKNTTQIKLTIGFLLLNFISVNGQINPKDIAIPAKKSSSSIQNPPTSISAEEFNKLSPLRFDYLSYEFYHSLRIPGHHIQVKIKNINEAEARVTFKSEPPEQFRQEWKHAIIDTTFTISGSEYQKAVKLFNEIKSTDICDAINICNGIFSDGTMSKLEYGTYASSIVYEVWNPDTKSIKRKMKEFLRCCEYMKVLSKHAF